MFAFAIILIVIFGINSGMLWAATVHPEIQRPQEKPGSTTFNILLYSTLAVITGILLLPEDPTWFGKVLLADLSLAVVISFGHLAKITWKTSHPVWCAANALGGLLLAIGVLYFYVI
ncbi:hypothetical protein ACFL06_00840 [Patescibacteria group bacterium]